MVYQMLCHVLAQGFSTMSMYKKLPSKGMLGLFGRVLMQWSNAGLLPCVRAFS